MINVPFQQYVNCRHLNFHPRYEYGRHGGFLPFRKSGILGLVDHLVFCTKTFLEVIGPYKNVKQKGRQKAGSQFVTQTTPLLAVLCSME